MARKKITEQKITPEEKVMQNAERIRQMALSLKI